MRIELTPLDGLAVVTADRFEDERGYFVRTFDAELFASQDLDPAVSQCSVSYNRRRGTLRGMHFQAHPGAEAKLVRCSRGRVFDVAVDLREASPTRYAWHAVILDAKEARALFVPVGFAHGFLTLTDDAEVSYQISTGYRPELARGVRWDDPLVGIEWPEQPVVLSERDRNYPLLTP